jgi:acetyltransferase-like isoleucine patch superfamily enzyme
MKNGFLKKIKHKALLLYSWFIKSITFLLPDFPLAMRFRGWLYGLGMKTCGKDLQVGAGARLIGLEFMSFGDHCYISPGCAFIISRGLSVSDDIIFGPYVVIADGDHTLFNGAYRLGKRKEAPVSIGRGSWVAAHVTITQGAHIGERALVGANSVVVGHVGSDSKVGGVPAKKIA